MSTPDINVSSSSEPIMETSPGSSVVHGTGTLTTLVTLIRREFWEHRSLWMTPLAIAGLIVVCAFPARVDVMQFAVANPGPELFGVMQWAAALPQFLAMTIVLSFYLLDCLYTERKDRSILFWKSLPVSDAATVWSKLLVALVVVPLGVYLLAIVTSLLFSAILMVRASLGSAGVSLGAWSTLTWLRVEASILFNLIVAALWYAPLAAFMVLVSAWARRNVFLWATLSPLVVVYVEWLAFGTHYVRELIQYRTFGIWSFKHSSAAGLALGHDSTRIAAAGGAAKLLAALGNIDVWLGLLVAGLFAFAAIRIRRYRDDT